MAKSNLARFNPDNAKSWKDADVQAMWNLSKSELKELAEAYPNKPTQKPYLVLENTKLKAHQQTFPVSTWANLFALILQGAKHFVAAGSRANFSLAKTQEVAEVQDLTKDQATSELKNSAKNLNVAEDLGENDGKEVIEEFPDLGEEAVAKTVKAAPAKKAAAKPTTAKKTAAKKGK